MMASKKQKYIVATLIPIIFVMVLFPFHNAKAGWIDSSFDKIITQGAAWIGSIMLSAVGLLTGLAGKLLDISIEYSIIDTQFFNEGVVRAGWLVSRDIANMFFIFILLYIGLSMILQLSNINTKKMLLSVIIIALLVNFSFPFTRIIIDASNIFAMEFLCAMTAGTCKAENISTVFANGFQFQTTMNEASGKIDFNDLNPTKIIMAAVGGSMILLIATFVFFALALLFIIRTIVLMILLIFAPLAYMAMILPATSGYAKAWWNQLFKQCLMAPAVMFMLYLTARMITNPVWGLKAVFATSDASFWAFFTDPGAQTQGSINLFMQLLLVAGMLLGSILVAQKMGAIGASGAIKLAHGARRKATGYAGTINRRYGTGKLAQKTIDSKTAQAIARIPILGKTIRPIAKAAAKRREDYGKEAGAYTRMAPSELATTLPGLTPEVRKAVASQLDNEKMTKMASTMTPQGQLSFGKKLYKQDHELGKKFAAATKDLSVAGKIIQKGEGEEAHKQAMGEVHDTMNTDQIKGLNLKKLGQDPAAMEVFLQKTSAKNFEQITTASRDNMKDMSGAIKTYGENQGSKGLTETLRKISKQNKQTADYLGSSSGTQILTMPEKVIITKGKVEKKSSNKEDVEKTGDKKTTPGE